MPWPSPGPKLFWTSPNCFSYESKGKILLVEICIFLVQSKPVWFNLKQFEQFQNILDSSKPSWNYPKTIDGQGISGLVQYPPANNIFLILSYGLDKKKLFSLTIFSLFVWKKCIVNLTYFALNTDSFFIPSFGKMAMVTNWSFLLVWVKKSYFLQVFSLFVWKKCIWPFLH